jgi:hypothetical protein
VTIYERQVDRTSLVEPTDADLPEGAMRQGVDFGGQIRLLGAAGGGDRVRPGSILGLTLYWQALEPVAHDYVVFVHLLGEHERVIAQRDGPPGLGARPTSHWTPDQVVVDPYLLALPEAVYVPDQAVWEVGLYDAETGQRLQTDDGDDNVRFGAVSVLPGPEPLCLDFGPVALTGYELDRLALSPGETLQLSLHWDGAESARVTVQLVDEAGQVRAQVSGGFDQEMVELSLGADSPPGAYDLDVIVTDPATGTVLPLLGADGQPRSDRARLTKVRLYR